MEICQTKKDELLRNAEILLLKSELLMETCNGWLPEDEGYKNMERRIRERWKIQRKRKNI